MAKLAILAKIARGLAIIAINVPEPCTILAKIARNACNGENGKKIASLWRFELDTKSGPLEAVDFGENGDFGEIGDFGKNRQRAGNIQNVAKY